MKKISAINQVVAAITISAACALPVMAQNTAPADTSQPTAAVNATTTERNDDNDRDYGWIGLLGLAGLLGMRRKPEEHRPTNNLSQQR